MHGRFQDLRAPSIPTRLQLAALYAATSTLLPEPWSSKTGAQTAMQLVRQCWTDAPLTAAEQAQLSSIVTLGGHYAGGLQLLVHELQQSTQQLRHLYGLSTGSGMQPPHPDAGILYLQDVDPPSGGWLGFAPHPCLVLTPNEEERTLGVLRPPLPAAQWLREMRQSGRGQVGWEEGAALSVLLIAFSKRKLSSSAFQAASVKDGTDRQATYMKKRGLRLW